MLHHVEPLQIQYGVRVGPPVEPMWPMLWHCGTNVGPTVNLACASCGLQTRLSIVWACLNTFELLLGIFEPLLGEPSIYIDSIYLSYLKTIYLYQSLGLNLIWLPVL